MTTELLRQQSNVGQPFPDGVAITEYIPREADLLTLILHAGNDNISDYAVDQPEGSSGRRRAFTTGRFPVEAISSVATVFGRSHEQPRAVVPYPRRGWHPRFHRGRSVLRSRWAGVHFSFPEGDEAGMQVLRDALAGFLIGCVEAGVILERTSKRTWQLWAIAPVYRRSTHWYELLTSCVPRSGESSGMCRLFPNAELDARLAGYGMRGPGLWNPWTGKLSEIVDCRIEPLRRTILNKEWAL